MSRPLSLAAAILAGLLLSAGTAAAAAPRAAPVPATGTLAPLPAVTAEDAVVGRADARITVIEYASTTCPHCADWDAEVYPAFKARFIDTGRVRYVLREMPTDPAPVSTAAFLMARCAGAGRFLPVVQAVYRAQREMFADGTTRNARPVLLRIAAANGLDEAAFNRCITSPAGIAALERRVQGGVGAGVDGTPTFFVNGRMVIATVNGQTGPAHDLDSLSAAIAAASTPRRPSGRR